MSDALNAFSEESGQDPAEIKKFVQDAYSDIFPVIEEIAVAGDAVDFFHRWNKEFDKGEFPVLDALVIFDDLELITRKSYENALLLLDYASSHGVIELDCSKFLESKESSTSSQRGISIEQLRQAVINDYAYLCANEGGTESDEISLEDYKKSVSEMTWEQLMEETSVNSEEPSNKPGERTLEEYVEIWVARTQYADLNYIKNEDGSTTLSEENQ